MRSLGSFVVASLLVAALTASTDAQTPATRTQWKMQSSCEFAADYYWKGANPYKIVKP